jgi:hypothetical protein
MQETNLEILEMVHEGRIDARTGAELMEAAEGCPSKEEALRILRMFRENKVTIDEAKELLLAMARPELEEEGREAALSKRKGWWASLARWKKIAITVGIVLLVWFFFPMRGFTLRPPFTIFWPVGILFVPALVFWVWMFVDCIRREHLNFGSIFTPGGRYEKLVWLGILAITGIIGAIAYFLVLKRREISLPRTKLIKKVETHIPAAPLILLDAISVFFALWLSLIPFWPAPAWLDLKYRFNWSPFAVIGVFVLFFAIFGLYGKKGSSLARIFCAVAVPLIIYWLIVQVHMHGFSVSHFYLDRYPLLTGITLRNYNDRLLFFGFLCFLFLGLYRKIFFKWFIREKVIEVETSGY